METRFIIGSRFHVSIIKSDETCYTKQSFRPVFEIIRLQFRVAWLYGAFWSCRDSKQWQESHSYLECCSLLSSFDLFRVLLDSKTQHGTFKSSLGFLVFFGLASSFRRGTFVGGGRGDTKHCITAKNLGKYRNVIVGLLSWRFHCHRGKTTRQKRAGLRAAKTVRRLLAGCLSNQFAD